MQLNEVHGIVTGGAAGFGRAFADKILAGGGKVVITDINVEQLELTGQELAKAFGRRRIAWTPQNVTDPESFHRVFDFAAKFFERPVNVLVNNAGIAGDLAFWNDDAPRTWERVVDIDLTAVVRGSQVAVQQFKEHLHGREGVVVNISSVAGLHPVTYSPEYAAAKAGVVGFTRSCHQLQQQANIRVVALCPGFAATAMGRLADEHLPDEMAAMGGLMDVSRVVDGFLKALTEEGNGGRVIRIVQSGMSYYRYAGDKLIYPNAKL